MLLIIDFTHLVRKCEMRYKVRSVRAARVFPGTVTKHRCDIELSLYVHRQSHSGPGHVPCLVGRRWRLVDIEFV